MNSLISSGTDKGVNVISPTSKTTSGPMYNPIDDDEEEEEEEDEEENRRQLGVLDDNVCVSDIHRLIQEKDHMIQRQFMEIEELRNQVLSLSQDRDQLSCEVSKLRFELEMSGLQRLRDVR